MRRTIYRYNIVTCQYERVGINAKNVVWYVLGVVAMAACMLVGILLLHDLIVNTPTESRLRKENKALKRHHALLSTELNTLQPVLTSLRNKDRTLHTKFFGAPPVTPAQDIDRASKEKLLLADARTFPLQVAALKAAAKRLVQHAEITNHFFSTRLKLTRDDLEFLGSRPTLLPIIAFPADRLISGFGLRVNPFHKGLYEHLGVDIAMPRGTPVVATGNGVVSKLKRSDLQAGYGNYIEVDHGNGSVTRYAHLEDINVRLGKKVLKGDTIATVGTSGGSVAPHLHYEVLQDDKNVDPIVYMIDGLTSEAHYHLARLSHQQNQSLD